MAGFTKKSLLVVVMGVIAGLGIGYYVGLGGPKPSMEPVSTAVTATPASAQDVYTGNPVAAIVKRSSPAVVNIDTEETVQRSAIGFPFDDPFFRDMFGGAMPPRTEQRKGKGSGFIVTKDGYILTNNHVVRGADKVTVTLEDGRLLPAQLVGSDPTFDLAVIKIKGDNLPVLPLGDSDRIDVGEWVITIGNPYGFEHTVTVGVVSAKNRTIQVPGLNFQGFIQTDAAINPGNSGGPMLGLDGKVIGINTAIVPYAQGIGFAVPVNMAKQVMDDLIKHGEVKRGWLGVVLQTMTPAFAEAYGVPVPEGAVVGDVMNGSPAASAGLTRGDVIVGMDGKKVKNAQDVVFGVRQKLAGDNVVMDVYRQGAKKSVTVTLSPIPSDKKAQQPMKPGKAMQDTISEKIGASAVDVTPELKSRHKLPDSPGVLVVSVNPGSLAAKVGLQPGDLVMEINRRPINGLSDWDGALKGTPKALAILVWREGQTIFITYKN